MNGLPIGKIQALTARVVENAQDAALTATITAQLAAARIVANAQDIALDATTATYVTAARVEKKLLGLPRPLRSSTDDELVSALSKLGSGLVTTAYMVKSGKTTTFGLVDRRLNKFGKVSARIGLVMTATLTPLVLHEFWARQREKAIGLKKTAAESMQNMSYADTLAALKRPIDLDQFDDLLARMAAAPVGSISDLRFDQITTGQG